MFLFVLPKPWVAMSSSAYAEEPCLYLPWKTVHHLSQSSEWMVWRWNYVHTKPSTILKITFPRPKKIKKNFQNEMASDDRSKRLENSPAGKASACCSADLGSISSFLYGHLSTSTSNSLMQSQEYPWQLLDVTQQHKVWSEDIRREELWEKGSWEGGSLKLWGNLGMVVTLLALVGVTGRQGWNSNIGTIIKKKMLKSKYRLK